jgi:type VI secretion system protein VasJ
MTSHTSQTFSAISAIFPGVAPFGQDISHDPEFDLLRNEFGKPSFSDTDSIEQTAISILSAKSKDLRIFFYVSYLFARSDRWEEFAALWESLSVLVEKDFGQMFPLRPRAKFLAIAWLGEPRFADMFSQKNPDSTNNEHLEKLAGFFIRVKKIVDDFFPEGSPFPVAFLSRVQSWTSKKSNTAAIPDSVKPSSSPAPAMSSVASAPASAAKLESPKQAREDIRRTAIFLIDQEPDKSVGYRLLRTIRWDSIESIPPLEEGVTRISPPDERMRTGVREAFGRGEWKQLLSMSERVFAAGSGNFWLDTQRYSVLACKNLGGSYARIADVIVQETTRLHRRISGLFLQTFSDGTPFADEDTVAWTNTICQLSSEASVSDCQIEAVPDSLYAEALALAQSGSSAEALGKIGGFSVDSNREKFLRDTVVARIYLLAKKTEAAVALLEDLNETIAVQKIDLWEPSLALDVWMALLDAYRSGKAARAAGFSIEKARVILARIARINPSLAFGMIL